MGAGNPNLLPWQRNLLWAAVMIVSLTLTILGIVLSVRSLEEEKTTLAPPTADRGSCRCTTPSTPAISSTMAYPYLVNSQMENFRFAAVSSGADPCNTMGTKMMANRGGSAVDAAIVTVLCVGLANLHNNGIGGGNFMLIYERPNNGTDKVMTTIFARERAPLASTVDMFQNVSSLFGGMAIAVPGEIKGLHFAWQKFGRIPWRDLVQPVIDLCKNGIVVNKEVAKWNVRMRDLILANPGLREIMGNADGQLKVEGDRIYRPKLIDTLERIAEDPNSFYDTNSQLAQDIVADIADNGGIVSLQDLASYIIEEKAPISVHLSNGNYTAYAPPAPSGGPVLLFILNILDGYNFTPDDIKDAPSKVLTFHRITEAFKFAFAKRSELGDGKFVPDVYSLVTNLTSEWFADETRAKIDDDSTYNISHYEPAFEISQNYGTSQVSILSPEGSAVSMTSTINIPFGAHVRGNRTGILFNDEMDDFSSPGAPNNFGVPPSPSNFIQPGKIPVSSMTPTIITDANGKVVLLVGAAGGTRIITGTAIVTMLKIWFGLPLNEATDHPRFHHQLAPNILEIAAGFDEEVKQGLTEKGHTFGVAQIDPHVMSVFNDCGPDNLYDRDLCISAVSDARKAGRSDGF